MDPRERVAYHEAGHCLAHLVAGHGVTEIALDATGGYCQAIDWDYRRTLPARPDGLYTPSEQVNAARAFAVALLAGNVAEARYAGLDALRECWGADDLAHVEGWLRQVVHPDDYESAAAWLTSHATWLVDESWDAIERVAQALLERTVLNGEQVAELAERHSPGA